MTSKLNLDGTNCDIKTFKTAIFDLEELLKEYFMENEMLLSEELISNKIYFIRNQKVMIDRDLAAIMVLKPKD